MASLVAPPSFANPTPSSFVNPAPPSFTNPPPTLTHPPSSITYTTDSLLTGRSTIIEEFYLVLGYRAWYDPAKIENLSIRNLDVGWQSKVKAPTFTNLPSTFRYSDLPKEVQIRVLEALFRDCRADLNYRATVTLWFPCAVKRPILAANRALLQQDICHLGLAVPEDFIQLFVSKAFLKDALPVFAKYTTIDLWEYHIHPILQALGPYPLLESIFTTLLAKTHTLALEDWNFAKPAELSQYAKLLTCWTPKVHTIEVHTEAPLLWKAKNRNISDCMIWDHKNIVKSSGLQIIGYEDSLHFAETRTYPPNMEKRLKKTLFEDPIYRKMRRLAKTFKVQMRLQVVFYCKISDWLSGPVGGVPGTAKAISMVLTFDVVKSELVSVEMPPFRPVTSTDRMWMYEHAAAEFLCDKKLPDRVIGGCRNSRFQVSTATNASGSVSCS